ncbi:MAG: M48 family metallopeptidase [Anaerolineae bacterium]|nr:M48 family metallopeptidase [Anaerolineae bacterium]
MPTYTFGSTKIYYDLVHSKTIKAVKIVIEFEHGVEVVIPHDFEEIRLEAVLRKKAPWILEKLQEIDQITALPLQKEYVSGEKFPLLGHMHTLIVEERAERKPFTVMKGSDLIVTVKPGLRDWDRRAMVRETLRQWYVRQAEQKLPEQIELHIPMVNVHPDKIAVVDLDKRWGSCTPRGTINVNWRLVMAPIHVVDYIAVHELCHLLMPDHSNEFWSLVWAVLPDYEERREWLRINGPTLTL